MARSGLRMMPTSPSPSLKFRTAGFPRYGFKASLSDRAFPGCSAVKPAPGIPSSLLGLHRPFSRFRCGPSGLALSPSLAAPLRAAVREALASLPQGSLAPVRVMLSRSIIAYYDPIRRSREHAATSRPCRLYAAPSLCGSALATHETFPTFPAVLSTRAADPTPVGSRAFPVMLRPCDTRLPRVSTESPPTSLRLCQQYPTELVISALHRSRHAAARLFAQPSWLAPTRWDQVPPTAPSEDRVTPAFDGVRRRAPLGVRLEGRTGNSPSSGLSPDQFTAGSQAAQTSPAIRGRGYQRSHGCQHRAPSSPSSSRARPRARPAPDADCASVGIHTRNQGSRPRRWR